MTSVLWACVVHEPDARWLPAYLGGIATQSVQPDKVVIIDSGRSELIRRVVAVESRSTFEHCPLDENLGFNAGLNKAIGLAITGGYEWLATMTVRATPEKEWLHEALRAGGAEGSVGMVTTLHLGPDDKIDCLGHNLGPQGQLREFGESLTQRQIEQLPRLSTGELPIWSPCSGGAIYKTAALSRAKDRIKGQELVRPRGFKSYNCDALGYVIRAAGYRNCCARNAICKRDRTGSSSKRPTTKGLKINQEINRVANLIEFWEPSRMKQAIAEYLKQDRQASGLKPVDLIVARTLGEGLASLDSHARTAS
jgi:hypothetical protein